MIKSSEDIKKIAESGKITSGIFSSISDLNLEGMSTWDLDLFIERSIRKNKAQSAFKTVRGYGFSSCISINNEVVHGVPSKKKIIKNGDIIKVDVGVVFNGFFSDSCRTINAGQISSNAKDLINVTEKALTKAIPLMVPGNRMGDIGHAVQSIVEFYGYSVVKKFTGHGIGYSLHEAPVVPHYGKEGTGMILREGMVLAVEPIVNEGSADVYTLEDGWTEVTSDGKLSAQFEHTIAITADKPEILTA